MITNGLIKEIQERHGNNVDLDLSIKAFNLSLKEADNMLDAFAEFTFRVTAPDTESPKAEKKVPDPTYEEILRERERTVTLKIEDLPGGSDYELGPNGPFMTAPLAPIAPALKKKYAPATETKPPAGKKKRSAFGIPKGLHKSDKTKYDRIWGRCKRLGIQYEAALAMEKTAKKDPPKKKMGREPLATTAPAMPEPEPEPAPVAPEKETVPWPGQAKLRELTKAKNGTLAVGQKVKHNGSRASPYYGMVGEITAINREELHVTFPGGSTRLPSYLVLAMPKPLQHEQGGQA